MSDINGDFVVVTTNQDEVVEDLYKRFRDTHECSMQHICPPHFHVFVAVKKTFPLRILVI